MGVGVMVGGWVEMVGRRVEVGANVRDGTGVRVGVRVGGRVALGCGVAVAGAQAASKKRNRPRKERVDIFMDPWIGGWDEVIVA